MRNSNQTTLSARGFTLLELMITIAIALIVLSISVPSFINLLDSNRLAATRDTLVSSLQRAQQQAMSQSVSAYLCPSDSGNSCASQWDGVTGWMVFVDRNRDGSYTAATDVIVLVERDMPAQAIEADSALIRFLPSGHTTEQTFSVCGQHSGVEDLRFQLSRSGRVSHVVPANNHCG
ncbi:GspH/FimT family pseudopilin [Ferrimonas senticii]|uniref:GspH/FimT family pseudopilin n=1 Tax=Ferrimonas senticii TaxID=394566 RepID=UPI00040FD75D|nr:GspH/FimT family pseudopilin [Ferrimonas senticii]